MADVHVYYYTDPACPWSWAFEPIIRKLAWALGGRTSFTYVMCGMAREFGDAVGLVDEALEASYSSGMPVDPRLWLHDPPRSSHPACIAVKAAAEQGDPSAYLRRLREGFACRRRRLDGAEALIDAARAAGDLDIDRFRIDLSSHATLEAFGADLERAGAERLAEHRSQNTGRVKLPSIEFVGPNREVHGVYGFTHYESVRRAAVEAEAAVVFEQPPSIEDALRHFGPMSTAEVAAVCELPGPRAPAELWRLGLEWTLRPERLGNGELWSFA
jgi:predicted DsbA family dithiol-disulfide isomerase